MKSALSLAMVACPRFPAVPLALLAPDTMDVMSRALAPSPTWRYTRTASRATSPACSWLPTSGSTCSVLPSARRSARSTMRPSLASSPPACTSAPGATATRPVAAASSTSPPELPAAVERASMRAVSARITSLPAAS